MQCVRNLDYNLKLTNDDVGRIDHACDYILKNFRSEITLEEISDACYMNGSSFCRYFKRKTGKTFTFFVNEVRLEHACKLLLANSDFNISEVAFTSGYNSTSYFNKVFKEMKGCTPQTYIKNFLPK